uniref:Adenosine deaminase n=1 Tax=Ixodes ricinus TaxID=34613 RepID=A0A6B0VAB3_IXORI
MLPRYKIQLHTHLDGHLRHSTIWELAQAKKMNLGYASLADLIRKTKPAQGSTLQNYLKEMPVFLRTIVGDRDALVRVAYEAGVDQGSQGVLYSEMRLFPQMLASSQTSLPLVGSPRTMKTARDVVEAALEGFRRAEKEYDVKLRLVLACFRDMPDWAPEVLGLCQEFQKRGVVGIDVCGVFKPKQTASEGEEILTPAVIKAFEKAAELGVHRTAHAGEAGPSSNITRVIEELRTERIGHGYSALREGGGPYKLALQRGIHFEICPTSSYLTGAVKPGEEHPLLRLKRDHASYSLNTDDPTITQTKVDDEYQLCLKVGLLPSDILNSNRAAIAACFLPPIEKEELKKKYERLTAASSL